MAKLQYCLLVLSFVLVVSIADATQFRVGDSKGWTVPNDPKQYGQWAEKRRFHIGDSLLFVYLPDMDSVLLVNETAYRNCNTSSAIDKFDDGNTVFMLSRPGPHYFISGNRDNCRRNESLVVVVMADRSNKGNLAPSPSVLASPPPPPGSVEFSPMSTPNGQGSKSNGATTSKVVGSMGSFGAFMGSLFFVL